MENIILIFFQLSDDEKPFREMKDRENKQKI